MGLNYSKLNNTAMNYQSAGWNNLQLSNITRERRNQLRHSIDDFACFTWRGVNAFDAFGAFIINNKNSLKFYNGPTYSNEYTKPMFESAAGQLTGVTFSQQRIDFTVGVYWISEDHYRQLIYWLHPYAVDTLTFDFEDNWYYQVKLASVENGNRYVVGTEIVNGKKQYMYYTEMKVTFEVQGPNCVYRKEMYEFDHDEDVTAKEWKISKGHGLDFNTDLPTSFQVTFDIDLKKINNNGVYITNLYVDSKQVFSITLNNLTKIATTEPDDYFSIKYDSETGLCFWNHSDSEYNLLTRLSTLTTGSRFVNSLTSKAYMTEGCFNNPDFDVHDLRFKFDVGIIDPTSADARCNIKFLMRARSNII